MRRILNKRNELRERSFLGLASVWNASKLGPLWKVPSDGFHQTWAQRKSRVPARKATAKHVKSLKGVLGSCKEYDNKPLGKACQDIQVIEGRTEFCEPEAFCHIPFVNGLVRSYPPKERPNLPYYNHKTKSPGNQNWLVYDNPTVFSAIRPCLTRKEIKFPPKLDKLLLQGPRRDFRIYMDRRYLRYSRTIQQLEHSLHAMCKNALKSQDDPEWSSCERKRVRGTLFASLRDFDPTVGYRQSKPFEWKAKPGRVNNQLFRTIQSAIRATRRSLDPDHAPYLR